MLTNTSWKWVTHSIYVGHGSCMFKSHFLRELSGSEKINRKINENNFKASYFSVFKEDLILWMGVDYTLRMNYPIFLLPVRFSDLVLLLWILSMPQTKNCLAICEKHHVDIEITRFGPLSITGFPLCLCKHCTLSTLVICDHWHVVRRDAVNWGALRKKYIITYLE